MDSWDGLILFQAKLIHYKVHCLRKDKCLLANQDIERRYSMQNELIKSIELIPVHVPFNPITREAMASSEGGLGMAIQAEESWLGADFVICKLETNEGTVGLGEVFIWLPETGVTTSQITNVIEEAFSRYIIGENPFDVLKVNERMDKNVARNEVAKGLVDMAFYDLMGKIVDKPCRDLIGGTKLDKIPLAALIPLGPVDKMLEFGQVFYNMKYPAFRIKLGKNKDKDKEVIAALRDAFGDDIRIRVDYNQAYTPNEAINAIQSIEPFNIDFIEQPVHSRDFLAFAEVQKNVSIPLMAHESFFAIQDFIVLLELQAVGILGLNSERPGGVTKALQAIDYASKKGIPCVLHNQPLGIASAMHIHLHCANPSAFSHPTELFGHMMLEDDLIMKPIQYRKGMAHLPEGPGWGVKLDEKATSKYQVGNRINIK